ncbi:MAG: ABC transporter ATP-binding protein [Acetatifactor sp.]|jgi:ABC-type nitrate/sulfonate/bicarbonate transport system ATPase subunit|nr:ABC transporter ATP-binding protein [Acetatifactor sp.]
MAPVIGDVLRIQKVKKTFGEGENAVTAIKDVSLKVKSGEIVVIIGPSGCGKTTLLRLIAGLDKNYEGNILNYEGNRIEGTGLDRGVIFQDHRLLPWLTVEENVLLGLKGSKEELAKRADKYLEKVELKDFKKAYPRQLSGGMAHRVAIARTLIRQPDILLLDEPFGALDALTKMSLQEEIERIWQAEHTTMIMITHDIEEAVYLADRIIVMSQRPAEIDEIFNINLPRPRDRKSEEFVRYRNAVLNTFQAATGSYVI